MYQKCIEFIMMKSTNNSYKRQLSLFPGKCEICGKPEKKFTCCKSCIKEWIKINITHLEK